MDSKKSLYCTLILVWVFSLFGVFNLTYEYQENKWRGKVSALQKEAEEKYNQEILAILEKERNLQNAVQKLESESNENLKQISALRAHNRQLIHAAGGLRDPGRGSSGGSTKERNSSSSVNTSTRARAVLSGKATEFLLDLTTEADRIREQLKLCQNWAKEISR